MKIYTRGGDRGETSLLGGGRVKKSDLRIDAYGTVDELNSVIGVVRAHLEDEALDGQLHRVQSELFDIGAQLASPDHQQRFPGVRAERITALEEAIDAMEASLAPLKNFVLPGGTTAAAQLHVARTVCRRAERLVVALDEDSENAIRTLTYLNRLSDYLFVAARFVNARRGVPDVPWISS